eukprot:6087135-Prorocentrum_lima.AAC.1
MPNMINKKVRPLFEKNSIRRAASGWAPGELHVASDDRSRACRVGALGTCNKRKSKNHEVSSMRQALQHQIR